MFKQPADKLFPDEAHPSVVFSCLAADPLDGDEYLDITGIMRNQAGRYECKASNDVAMPDVKYVNVVVNCKYGGTAALPLLRQP